MTDDVIDISDSGERPIRTSSNGVWCCCLSIGCKTNTVESDRQIVIQPIDNCLQLSKGRNLIDIL